MTQDELKQSVALAVLDYVEENSIIGVGSGSTIDYFIDNLDIIRDRIKGTVASSEKTAERLKKLDFPVFDLNDVDEIHLYIDSADACTPHRQLIKGRGGALTREKILAYASRQFICIADETKLKTVLSEVPVPIEVIPMARSFVAHEIIKLEGSPIYRQNFKTDNGNIILDIHNWVISEPIKLEKVLNDIPGVVSNGIFAEHPADLLLVRTHSGLKVFGAENLLRQKLLK